MSVAVTGAVLIGQFLEAAMVMVLLFNVGSHWKQRPWTGRATPSRTFFALAPDTATVLREDGSWREMDIREVAVGSRVRVKPGEKIALDGLVVSGRSMVNQAPITGGGKHAGGKESGDPVYAGTINESGSFEFDVTAAATNSTLARIIHAVEEARGSYAPCSSVLLTRLPDIILPLFSLSHSFRHHSPRCFWAARGWNPYIPRWLCSLSAARAPWSFPPPVSIVSGMAAATHAMAF